MKASQKKKIDKKNRERNRTEDANIFFLLELTKCMLSYGKMEEGKSKGKTSRKWCRRRWRKKLAA